MIHEQHDDYRNAWSTYKGLLALNVILFKLLLLAGQICLLIQ